MENSDKNEYVRVAFENKKVKHVIVPPTSVVPEGGIQNFYEYYAKNVGIRNSEGEFVLITNPDIMFTQEIVSSICEAINTDEGKVITDLTAELMYPTILSI